MSVHTVQEKHIQLAEEKSSTSPASLDHSYPFSPSIADRLTDRVKGLASLLIIPFWKGETSVQYCFLPFLSGEYGQSTTKLKEYAKRFFVGLAGTALMLFGVPFALAGHILTGLTSLCESENYRYLKGNAEETQKGPTKFIHLNTCMLNGGLPYSFGGVRPANERFDHLVKTVKELNSDMLFLCEFNRTLGYPMYRALKEDYTHFFLDVGLNPGGMENALFIASRKPIVSPPHYFPFNLSIEGSQKHMKRGFFAIETQDKWYLYTHLHPGDDSYDRDIRQKQLDKIKTFIDEKTGSKPCILLGDLNINRLEKNANDYKEMIERGLTDNFTTEHPEEITCSNRLELHIKGLDEKALSEEVLDYMLIDKKNQEVELKIDIRKTLEKKVDLSLSDHDLLIGTS